MPIGPVEAERPNSASFHFSTFYLRIPSTATSSSSHRRCVIDAQAHVPVGTQDRDQQGTASTETISE